MKSTRFHDEIWQILWQWNPADFMHEICWISWWNLPDFMAVESGGFHEIRWISQMKSGRFHHEIFQMSWQWNLPDFMADLGKWKLENVKFL